jgi:hypothetical protein
MYTPNSTCSAFIHLLLKFPVLIVALGLIGAVTFIKPYANTPDNPALSSKVKTATVQQIQLADKAPKTFNAIAKAESDLDKDIIEEAQKYFDAMTELGNETIGVHPDGKSYGSTGLTEVALKDVMGAFPDCASFGYSEILTDDTAVMQFSYLYFLNLIHRYKSIDIAVTAYHYGPTKVDKWRKHKHKLPTKYLNTVKSLVTN